MESGVRGFESLETNRSQVVSSFSDDFFGSFCLLILLESPNRKLTNGNGGRFFSRFVPKNCHSVMSVMLFSRFSNVGGENHICCSFSRSFPYGE